MAGVHIPNGERFSEVLMAKFDTSFNFGANSKKPKKKTPGRSKKTHLEGEVRELMKYGFHQDQAGVFYSPPR
jgi:hypothetical protein